MLEYFVSGWFCTDLTCRKRLEYGSISKTATAACRLLRPHSKNCALPTQKIVSRFNANIMPYKNYPFTYRFLANGTHTQTDEYIVLYSFVMDDDCGTGSCGAIEVKIKQLHPSPSRIVTAACVIFGCMDVDSGRTWTWRGMTRRNKMEDMSTYKTLHVII
jgi:hypothetical protein